MQRRRMRVGLLLSLSILALPSVAVLASSHREAPGITKTPKVDGTDFYMFRSYEQGRSGFVTFLANYQPLQEGGGPNFFMFDPNAIYEINIDRNGDAVGDMTFQFSFQNTNRNFTLPVGTTPSNTKNVAIPLINKGPIGPDRNDTQNLNVIESYSLSVIRGDRRSGQREPVTTSDGAFLKPVDRIGDKSLPAYEVYANDHIYNVTIPGCSAPGRVFVGQRREGFVINVDEVLDLVNTDPLGAPNGETNPLSRKNISTLALEVPISCVATPGQPIIGAWTTASVSKGSNSSGNSSVSPKGQFTQVSRLGMALVNEVIIGLKDKDAFNASEPRGDARFLDYVTNPTLPELLEILFPAVTAPNQFPRTDLVSVFLTGVAGVNQPPNVVPSEMLRLNTETAVVAAAGQNPLGVIGGDNAGYPNGRRPGDDVVDISLRVAMGKLLPAAVAPSGQLLFTDGAFINATVAYDPLTEMVTGDASRRLFRDTFPYLERPLSFSPTPLHP